MANLKLKGRIIEKFNTVSAFCNAVNTDEATISRKLNGKRAISVNDISKWIKVLDIAPEQIGYYFFE